MCLTYVFEKRGGAAEALTRHCIWMSSRIYVWGNSLAGLLLAYEMPASQPDHPFLVSLKLCTLPPFVLLQVIPALGNWEEVLFLTNPETWTPHATFAATRIFASNFNPAKAQRFFNLVRSFYKNHSSGSRG